jgi:hypothetical protein
LDRHREEVRVKMPSKYKRINCALTLLDAVSEHAPQWVAVRVDGPLNWSVVVPRSQEALKSACETDGERCAIAAGSGTAETRVKQPHRPNTGGHST